MREYTANIRDLIIQSTDLLTKSNIPEPELDARILLSNILGYNMTELYMKLEEIVSPEIVETYINNVKRRTRRFPLWYITGEKEFMGLKFKVSDGVLIPRPETELLVEEVIKIFNQNPKPVERQTPGILSVLDIGTGCGNIAISLARYIKEIKIVAVDISKKALEIAIENADMNNVCNKIIFLQDDLFNRDFKLHISSFMPFDIIVSNPPYISRTELNLLQPEIMFEPEEALDGGTDGLKFYVWFAENVGKYLRKGGYFIVEVGYNQAQKVKAIFEGNNLNVVGITKDYSGYDRVIITKNG